jgi:hypothetical protein
LDSGIQQTVTIAGGEATIEELRDTIVRLSIAVKDLSNRIAVIESKNTVHSGYYRGEM